jgi:hypothetical protein
LFVDACQESLLDPGYLSFQIPLYFAPQVFEGMMLVVNWSSLDFRAEEQTREENDIVLAGCHFLVGFCPYG